MINISDIFGDHYGKFIQTEPISFEVLELSKSDMLNFEIKNNCSRNVSVIVIFSEDPENSCFSNPDSSTMDLVLSLFISGFLLFLGILVSIVGVIISLIDFKNNKDFKRNY